MNEVTSTLSVRIDTGRAAQDLLALQAGLEGAATGVKRLGREIQNHSGNIQRVLGELSKHGFSGLGRSMSAEAGRVGAGMRQLEREVELAASRGGKKAGKALSDGMSEGVTGVSAKIKHIVQYFELVSREAKASSSQVRSMMEATTTLRARQEGDFRDMLGMYHRLESSIRSVEAAERAFAASTTARVKEAVAGLSAENVELAKMRAHYSAIQRADAIALAKSFETRGVRSADVRNRVGALTANPAADAGLKDYYLTLERVSVAVDKVRAREDAWASASSSRISQAVAGLSAENAELAKMQAHYSAIQRADARARASSFERFGMSATKGNLQAAIAARSGAGAGPSTMSLEYAEGRSAFGAIERASKTLGDGTPGIDKSRAAMKKWSAEAKIVHDTARGAAAGVGYLWMTWGNIGAMAAGFAAVRSMGAGLKEAALIEKELTFAAQAGGGSVEEMTGRIMDMYGHGNKMVHTAGEISTALKNLTLAGFSTDEAFQMLAHTYKFAAAGEMDLAAAAQGVQQTMNSFRLPMSETGRVTDVLAKAAAASAVTIDDMVQAMKTGSVVGAMYNVSIEDFAKSAALLGKVGIYGQAAGTAIKNFYTELSSPKSKKADEAMKQLGLSFYEIDKAGRKALKPLSGIIDELRGKFRTLSGTDQEVFLGSLNTIFNERGIKEAAQLIKMTEEEYSKLNQMVSDSAGFVDTLYGKLSSTTQGIFSDLKTQGMASLTEALKEAEPTIKQVGESLRTLVTSSGFKEFLSNSIKLLAWLTQLMVDHGRQVLAAVAAYKAFQVASGILFAAGRGVAALTAAWTTMGRVTTVVAAGKASLLLKLAGVGRLLPGIGGLLAAGATAWAIWGTRATEASNEAGAAAETAAARVARSMERMRREMKFGLGDVADFRERYQELRKEHGEAQARYNLALKEGRHADAIVEIDKIENADAEIKRMRPFAQAAAARDRNLNQPAPAAGPPPKFDLTGGTGAPKSTSPLSVKDYSAEIKLYSAHLQDVDRLEREQLTRSKALLGAGLVTEQQFLAARSEARSRADAAAKEQLETYVSAQNDAAADALAEYMKQFKEASAKGLLSDEATVNKFDTLVNRMKEAYAKADQAREQYTARSGERERAEVLDQLARMKEKYGNPDDDIRRAQESVSALRAENDATRNLADAHRDRGTAAIEASIRSVEGLIEEAWVKAADIGLTYDQVEALYAKRDALNELKGAYGDEKRKRAEMEGDPVLGAKAGFKEYVTEAEKAGAAMKKSVVGAFKGMEDALVNFVMTGKLDFKSLANSIIADLIRIQVRQAIVSAATGVASMFANGGIMTSGGSVPLRAYSNGGIANSPQLAIYGEGRRPEAYVPLPDGRTIPVTLKGGEGGGSGGDVNTSIQINIASDGATTVTREGANKMAQDIEAAVMKVIMREKRPGGELMKAA